MTNPAPSVASPAAPAPAPATPFHPGEQAVQITAGVRDEAEARGQKMLTPQLVDAQREFFARLPYVVASHVDADGQPWASLLTGEPGFVQATPDGRVRVGRGGAAGPAAFDATPGEPVGLLGIELARRRRNRINGRVTEATADYFALEIDQGYGNCPKYITRRPWNDELFAGDYSADCSDTVGESVASLIRNADTFFIASSSGPEVSGATVRPQAWGADISHRGGEPGFVELKGNTLGNLQAYPRAGLLFLDFATGDIVQIAGTAELNHNGEHYRIAVTINDVRHWQQ